MVLLIQITLILNYNQFNHSDNSSNIRQEKLSLKNLVKAAEFEYYEKNGTISDTTTIEIELPDLSWNITELRLNFTNINQYSQLRTIEGNTSVSLLKPLYFRTLGNYIDLYGQEINFSEPTQVYGVYIYGFRTDLPVDTVYVRLTGFNDITYEPNSTLYRSREINISSSLEWYYQDFSSSPLIFNTDEYYLLIDGIEVYDQPDYYFGFNSQNPTYPSLWQCERNDDSAPDYDDPDQGEPLLCKILQKVNKTYFPEDLKMQGFIDQNYHDILNESQSGDGNLTLTNLNFKPDNVIFNIPVKINESNLELIYNVSYYIKLRKPVSVIIIEIGGGDGSSDSKSNVSAGIDPDLFYLTILAIIISFLAALFSYQKVRIIKRNKRSYRDKIFNKYMDVLNLNYVLVSDKLSGLNVYEQMISGKEMNPTLLSGFLQAISSFGLELTGSEDQSQTIRLEYQNSKILMSDFKNYRLINVFEENPSKEFMDSIEPLSQDIDKYFGKLLKNFDGETTKFAGIKELLERHLQISLVYPLKVVITDNTKLNGEEKTLVYQAINFMKKKNSDYFYISYLMSEGNFNPKRAEKILRLIERKIFQPVL